MRKYLFILLLCSSAMRAQDIKSDFQTFRKGMFESYDGFRKSVLEDYGKYLQGIWDEYELFRGVKRDKKPKPVMTPKAKSEPQKIPQVLPSPDINPIAPTPLDVPASTIPNIPSTSPTISFPFYGMKLNAALCQTKDMIGFEHKEIAKVWNAYQQDKTMKDVVSSLQALSFAYGLNDWFTFELVRNYAEATCKNIANRMILQHFLLINMGYDVRLASSGNQLLLLVPFSQQVYERNYLIIDGKRYYSFYNDSTHTSLNKGVYTCRLPNEADKGRDIDLTIKGRDFGIRTGIPHRFDKSDGQMTLRGSIDKGTMEAIRRYPQMDIPFYAMSTINSNFHESLLTQVKEQIQGYSEKEAVNRILHFMQYAFDYATDAEQHGYEKPYFMEENFFYPKNDCEDRAILFALLVHNLLNLDVHLVQYPGHECTAVNFTTSEIKGDGYMFKGKTYYICDPTYIGASIGQCMPEYRNVKPKIELWY